MKDWIYIFSLKGKEDIWWENVKCVRGINVGEPNWHEFKRFFRNKHLSKRYYAGKEKEFYNVKMGSMKNEVYMNMFLELLSYVPYIKDENTKVQRFTSGFPLEFKDYIEYNGPRSLEKVIVKGMTRLK